MLPNTRIKDTNVILRNANTHTRLPHRTVQYQRSFFQATSKQWNQLPSTTRELGHKLFKKKIRDMMGPPNPPYYNIIGTKKGNMLHTRLRNDMTQLNSHLFKIKKKNSKPSMQLWLQDRNSYPLRPHLSQIRQTKNRTIQQHFTYFTTSFHNSHTILSVPHPYSRHKSLRRRRSGGGPRVPKISA